MSTPKTTTDDDNAQLIKELQAIELRAVALLKIASDTVATFAADERDFDDAKEKFERSTKLYYQVLDEIQLGLRRVFRRLARAGILRGGSAARAVAVGQSASGVANHPGSIPYRANVFGDEKDLELVGRGTRLLLVALRGMLKEAGLGGEEVEAGVKDGEGRVDGSEDVEMADA
ncbi:hypothetical protein BJ742DRAFT_800141 [Cladochytrium replicatum]|nr:hypothetical protein BJ742DRAFT_800141 [Cladochytrium replicatum]